MAGISIRDPAGGESTREFRGDVVVFGRAADCDLVLPGRGISAHHGRFLRDKTGRWWIEDTGSKNGLIVAGQYTTRSALEDGTAIQAGELVFVFRERLSGPTSGPVPKVSIQETPQTATTELDAGRVRAIDARRLTALYDISRRLLDERDVTRLLDLASDSLLKVLNAESIVLSTTCDPEAEPQQVFVRPLESRSARVSRSILARTIGARRAVLIMDTGADASLARAESIRDAGIRCALCVPLLSREQVTGFIYVDRRQGGATYDQGDLEFASAVGALVGTVLENARLHAAELAAQRLEAELASARRVQQAILPSRLPTPPGWEIDGRQATSSQVGGDYYDAILHEGRLWLVIADVCGRGVPAALVASSIHTGVHSTIDACAGPSAMLSRLNALLLRRRVESSFVTCLAATVALDTGEVRLASAGHPNPIHLSAAGIATELPVEGGFMLGILPDSDYAESSLCMRESGEALLFYTDGVTEMMSGSGDQFGIERLLATVQDATYNRTGLSSRIFETLEHFHHGCEASDDATVLVCRCGVGV